MKQPSAPQCDKLTTEIVAVTAEGDSSPCSAAQLHGSARGPASATRRRGSTPGASSTARPTSTGIRRRSRRRPRRSAADRIIFPGRTSVGVRPDFSGRWAADASFRPRPSSRAFAVKFCSGDFLTMCSAAIVKLPVNLPSFDRRPDDRRGAPCAHGLRSPPRSVVSRLSRRSDGVSARDPHGSRLPQRGAGVRRCAGAALRPSLAPTARHRALRWRADFRSRACWDVAASGARASPRDSGSRPRRAVPGARRPARLASRADAGGRRELDEQRMPQFRAGCSRC